MEVKKEIVIRFRKQNDVNASFVARFLNTQKHSEMSHQSNSRFRKQNDINENFVEIFLIQKLSEMSHLTNSRFRKQIDLSVSFSYKYLATNCTCMNTFHHYAFSM